LTFLCLSPYAYIVVVNTPKDIGVLARQARRRAHMSQTEVGMRVGVSRQWIGALEAGHPRAELEIVLQTLAILGLEVSLDPVIVAD
jgi:DNA-binding XRE family transcriptional regulator